MKVTTAEFPDETDRYEAAFEGIAQHVAAEKSHLVVLSEMPFTPWIFCVDEFDAGNGRRLLKPTPYGLSVSPKT